ncbi:MAG: PDZ domain-containing protein [Planctomycetes bacterium]|nr:PDZ domain-containing protein [Planctomycetota bacterium]
MTLIAAMILSLAPQDQDRIQDLIRKLGSDDFTTREQATEELKKAGKAAREALHKAAEESEDPEVRQRSRSILEDLAKAEKPQPRRADPVPGRPGFGFGGSSVMVRSVNGDSTYTITPGDGSPVLSFHKAAAGPVKLDYVDQKGESKSAQAANLETFLKDQKELAQKYGISEEGIDYAGSRVSFKGRLMPNLNPPRFPFPQRRLPPVIPDEEEEGTSVAGALLGPVEDSLRAQLDIPEGQGAVVTKVTPGSLAASLGLRKSDILLELGGRKIASPESAKGLVLTKESAVVVLRKGKRETLGAKKDY